MEIKLPKLKMGRGYGFGYAVMGFSAALVGLAIWQTPGKTSFYLDYWKELAIWITPIVLGVKELGKGIGKFGDAQKLKHGNGNSIAAPEGK